VKLLFLCIAGLVLCSASLFAGDEKTGPGVSVSGLFLYWMDVEKTLYFNGNEDAGAFREALDRFNEAAEAYTGSLVFWQYEGTSRSHSGDKERIRALARTLAEESAAGRVKEAEKTAGEIRSLLTGWERYESDAANNTTREFYRLFVFFILIASLLFFLIFFLYYNLRRASLQARNASEFSRGVIMAQEQERLRISTEIHDTALQDLGRLMHQTREAENGGPLLAIERRIMDELRSACSAIMPPDFSRLYLADSLIQLCMDFEKRTGVECRASIAGDLDLGGLAPEKQLQCYRIVQEALNNIEKHSLAGEATVTVRNTTRSFPGERAVKALVVCVSDDGAGLGREAPASGAAEAPGKKGGGLGMRIMRERAAILGGNLDFLSEPGQGLTVRFEFPIGGLV
jgi:signal transduction histidine kinase